MLPKISDNLIVSKLDEELLIYHSKSEKAICLGSVGMRVFQACAGELSQEQLEQELRELGSTDVELTILETLAALRDEGLLAAVQPEETPVASFDRRRFLAAAGAAAALPVVLSALAPRPAYALSCVNCSLLPGNIPANCTDCGKKCPAGAGCSAVTTCNFEYVYDPANDGDPNPCAIEASGVFRCRATGGIFDPACNVSRNLLPLPRTLGDRYYCCQCATVAVQFSC